MDKGKIRQTARAVLDKQRSETTKKIYADTAAAMQRAGYGPEGWRDYAAEIGASKSRAAQLRAAAIVAAAEETLEKLREDDQRQRAKQGQMPSMAMRQKQKRTGGESPRVRATELAEWIDENADPNRKRGRDPAYHGTGYRPGPGAGRAQRRPKSAVKRLPARWDTQLIEAVRQRSGVADARAVAAMVYGGVRPSEIARGGVTFDADGDGQVMVVIQGVAKRTEKTGHDLRTVRLGINAIELEKLIGATVAGAVEPVGSAAAMSRRLERTIDHLAWNGRGRRQQGRITAYTLRHAFAARQKAAGVTERELAAAMGHQSTRSQTQYGHAKSGGGLALSADLQIAAATNEIRDYSPAPAPAPAPEPEPEEPGLT